jgi:tetratricopeptide (TPR) repeat protein
MEHVAKTARAYVIAERLQKNHSSDRIEFYRQLLSEIGWCNAAGKEKSSLFRALSKLEGAVREGRYLRLMPTRFESLLQDGLILAQVDGDREQAQAYFAEAFRMEPKSHLPCLFGANSANDAIMSLKRALALNPGSIKAWILLGEAHARKGNTFASLKAFESAAELFPEYEIPYARVASVLKEIGEIEAAADMAKKAQTLAVQ